ncbi:MAG: VWA domain-containing protein [Aureliella sp.]
MLTFLHPWLLILLLAPVAFRLVAPRRNQSEGRVLVPFLSRIDSAYRDRSLIENASSLRYRFLILSVTKTLAWILLIVALARPQWLEPPIERTIPTRDLLLLVDLSASMSNEDFKNAAGMKVDRLTAVQEVVRDFIEERQGDRVGLIVFGNAPFVQVPLTTDLEVCNQLLAEAAVGMAGPRTALGDAIGLAISILEESDTPEKTIIALTDGNDTASSVPPIEASRVASERDIRIHTIAVGDPESVGEEKIDTATLKSVAENTRGDYFIALDREELREIYNKLDEIETSEIKTVSHQPRREIFAYFAGAALLCSMLGQIAHSLAQYFATTRATHSGHRLKVNPRTFELETIEG